MFGVYTGGKRKYATDEGLREKCVNIMWGVNALITRVIEQLKSSR